ncbi:MAG: transglutaminase-like domain-containing protein [Lachnospiraceae bacterium]|nr:transglutaminase-like domain-containing protein [Lachnospiraceae bacterium]
MKKTARLVICIVVLCLLFTGCGSAEIKTENTEPSSSEVAKQDEAEITEDGDVKDGDVKDEDAEDADTADETVETEEVVETEEAKEPKERGHFTFQPVVIASIFRDIMGEDMCEAYGNYVEAALSGEDEFAVNSEETYEWMIGQFPGVCFPILEEYTESDYGGAYHDGTATFHYTIPKSEFARREAEFEDIVTGILNETMQDDYSDLEKVLALYVYFCRTYTYDYDTYEEMSDRYIEELSAYRFLTTDHGICSECAPAFSYLLLEAGVDATVAGGTCPHNGEGHAWSYVTINGKNYHLDPTYGMDSGVCLSYFMMTDEQREEEDGYKKSEMCVGCHYKDEQNGDQYDAEDDFFAPLWGGYLNSWDHEKNLIYYMDRNGNDAVFDYSAFE